LKEKAIRRKRKGRPLRFQEGAFLALRVLELCKRLLQKRESAEKQVGPNRIFCSSWTPPPFPGRREEPPDVKKSVLEAGNSEQVHHYCVIGDVSSGKL